MSFFEILGSIFIEPLKLVFEVIFQAANSLVNNPGLSIIFLSLMMNIMVLPLYRRADAMQEEAQDIDAKLRRGVAHIKKSFSGDERMMILQTYYRQNNYKPTDALKGSVSLLLEIPFFMAAYQFLSHLNILNGASLGPISDLGAPDGLIVIGGLTLNLLPILMTLINVISSALYLKGFPLKTKIQLYGMALFFLVFLYTSPAGLVFYWTLNNLFSLVKTIFYKIKEPARVLRALGVMFGSSITAFGIVYTPENPTLKYVLISVGIILILPMIIYVIKSKVSFKPAKKEPVPNKKLFFFGSLLLTLLVGVLIPSVLISASPQEFVDVTYFHNPLWYIVSSAALAAGTFLVWMRVFYWLAKPTGKVIFERLVWILCGVMVVNYMFFGTDLGNISPALQYDNGMHFIVKDYIVNICVILALALILFLIVKKWSKVVTPVLMIAVVALGVMSAVNIFSINKTINDISYNERDDAPHFTFTKNGQNVVVLMLDRAVGEYIPYFMEEKPELKEQFEGFTYYSNTLSYGGHTNFASPPLMGGYEYTPVEMNKRDDELLVDKHNEATLVMPKMFIDEGYKVTICDPPYANYKWIPDLSIYNDYPDISAYITNGAYSDVEQKQISIDNNHRNFFCFSLMKTMPLVLQPAMYNKGLYNQAQMDTVDIYSTQTRNGLSKAEGISKKFIDSYNVLCRLPDLSLVADDSQNNFLFITNEATHEPVILKEPEYVPEVSVDNTEYDNANKDRFTIGDNSIQVTKPKQMASYHANMASIIKLGEWFDDLREKGVYDNTRIIIVADHSYEIKHHKELILDEGNGNTENVEWYAPLLLVKDFDCHGEIQYNDEFMTNADVPYLATKDIIENPTNPFTGKPITMDEKYAHEQFVILSRDYSIAKNNKETFLAAPWASVKDNVWAPNNWTFYPEETVLKEHSAP